MTDSGLVQVGEVGPRRVLAPVAVVTAAAADERACRREILGVAHERPAAGDQLMPEIAAREGLRAVVARRALEPMVRAREQIEVIGLAGVPDRERLGEVRTL